MSDEALGKISQFKEQLAKATDVIDRLRLLTSLSDELINTSPREAEQYLLQLVAEARSAGRWECAGMALLDIAWSKFMGGQAADAVEIANQCLTLGREKNVVKVQASANNVLGLTFWQKGEFEAAIRHYEECRRVSRASNYPGGEATALGNLGFSCLTRGRIEEALGYFKESLPLHESLPEEHSEIRGAIATTYVNIGKCHEGLGRLGAGD